MNHLNLQKTLRFLGICLVALAVPSVAMAERPEIDCDSLSEDAQNEFYELSSKYVELRDQQDYSGALDYALKAMEMCTSDAYTEYNVARLSDILGNCAEAYYHYEILYNKPDSVKAKDKEIFADAEKHFKEIKEKCGDVVTLEITCETPDTMLTISGLPNSNVKCPFYGKVSPNTYTVVATKSGYHKRTETVVVPETGTVFKYPELRDVNAVGELSINCQASSGTFVLVDPDGVSTTYNCPNFYKVVPEGTYRVYLSDQDISTAATIVVERQQSTSHTVPKIQTSRCSATPLEHSSSPAGVALMALLGALGLVSLRRRSEK